MRWILAWTVVNDINPIETAIILFTGTSRSTFISKSNSFSGLAFMIGPFLAAYFLEPDTRYTLCLKPKNILFKWFSELVSPRWIKTKIVYRKKKPADTKTWNKIMLGNLQPLSSYPSFQYGCLICSAIFMVTLMITYFFVEETLPVESVKPEKPLESKPGSSIIQRFKKWVFW